MEGNQGMSVQQDVKFVLKQIQRLNVSQVIAPADEMFSPGQERHYFGVGKSAGYIIAGALVGRSSFPDGDTPIQSILDYGCGHGRIARYLRAMFPASRITGTDYIDAGARWCAENFRYEVLDCPVPRDEYDLIWLGSVFTHLPKEQVRDIILDLKGALRPGGLLIFTTQGRHSAKRIEESLAGGEPFASWLTYNLPNAAARDLVAQYEKGEYGYVDYPGQQGYGVTVVPISWYLDATLIGADYTIMSIQERAWDSHQDVVTLIRSNVLSLAKGTFY